MFYPAFPLFRYPKAYSVSGRMDADLCSKPFPEKRDFSHGMFSIGCCCKRNTTYGFEIMLQKESEHNLFRFLMNRDVKMEGPQRTKGVVYDNACNVDKYALNREPREFQYFRFLVDGSHWVSFWILSIYISVARNIYYLRTGSNEVRVIFLFFYCRRARRNWKNQIALAREDIWAVLKDSISTNIKSTYHQKWTAKVENRFTPYWITAWLRWSKWIIVTTCHSCEFFLHWII